MESYFSSQFFATNRQKLTQLFTGTAPIVITANGLLQRAGDDTYAFTQDANFWYLTGISEPDLILVLDKGKEYLIVPNRSETRQTFDGGISDQELYDRSGIKDILGDKDGWNRLTGRLKKVKHVATVASPGAYIEPYGFYTNPARGSLIDKIKAINPETKLLDLSSHLMRLRLIKQPEELKAIQAAINITVGSIKETMKPSKLKSYKYEYEVEAELSRSFKRRGATGHGFSPIIASGAGALTIHNMNNNAKLDQKDLILLDVGAEVEHYSADISRTYSLSQPTKRQQAVYQAVLDAQNYAMSYLKAGITIMESEAKMEQFLGEKLRELNLIKSISRETVREYYPHLTSHYLGLNVHDIGDHRTPIPAGAVITIEPGLYIKEEGIAVRIEDDVLITEKGAKLLSNKLPRTLQ